MEGTSNTPHLLTDVRFSVSRKGYDPDEVDNFLERVSGAVAQLQDKLRQAAGQAEAAEARLADSTKAQAVLQARIGALEAELAASAAAPAPVLTPVRSPEVEAEAVSKVLVLAQRTADAAIEEATATARTTVADAEAEANRLLADARAKADAVASERQAVLASEVRSLESLRDAIAADVELLERHVEEQRSSVAASVRRVQAVLDDPGAFRVSSAPAPSGASLADLPPSTPSAPAPAPTPAASSAPTPAAPAPAPDTTPAPLEVVLADETDAPADKLFAGPPATQAHAVLGDDSPLGPPDEEADAAMKAFFEAEFDDDPGKSAR